MYAFASLDKAFHAFEPLLKKMDSKSLNLTSSLKKKMRTRLEITEQNLKARPESQQTIHVVP